MKTLTKLFKDLCLWVLHTLTAYFYGKETARNEQLVRENESLKQGLDAAVHGDYSPAAVRERMRDTKPDA